MIGQPAQLAYQASCILQTVQITIYGLQEWSDPRFGNHCRVMLRPLAYEK